MIVIACIQLIYLFYLGRIAFFAFRKNQVSNNTELPNKVSFVIPFKNEAERIEPLLNSLKPLSSLSYIELLFVDDHSTDQTAALIATNLPSAKVLFNQGSGKKAAITTAIYSAQFDRIITLDADAELPANYKALVTHIPNQDLVVGPVYIQKTSGLLNALDRLEQMSIQTLSSGSLQQNQPLSASGAHLIYSKDDFKQLDGFDGNNHLASGDDVFILEKFYQSRKSISYWNNVEATVNVQGAKTFNQLLQQKKRWGNKVKHLQLNQPKVLGILIVLSNFSLILSPFIFQETYELILIFGVKWLTDLYVFLKGQTFFQDKNLTYWLPLLLFIFPFYNLFTVLVSQFGSTENW